MNYQICDSLCVGPRQGFFVEHLKAITKTTQSQWVENEEVVTEKEVMIWQSRRVSWGTQSARVRVIQTRSIWTREKGKTRTWEGVLAGPTQWAKKSWKEVVVRSTWELKEHKQYCWSDQNNAVTAAISTHTYIYGYMDKKITSLWHKYLYEALGRWSCKTVSS